MHRSGNKQRMFFNYLYQQKSVFYLGYFLNILCKMQIFFHKTLGFCYILKFVCLSRLKKIHLAESITLTFTYFKH